MRTLTLLYILFMSSDCILAQETIHPSSSEQVKRRCDFTEVYRAEGWEIPGISVTTAGPRASSSTSPGSPVKGIFVTIERTMGTKKDADKVFHLLLPQCQGLALSDALVRPLDIWKFDYEGKVFAYVVDYERQFLDNGIPRALGSSWRFVFLDIDGTGKFKLMKWDRPMKESFLFSPRIPDWAKSQGK